MNEMQKLADRLDQTLKVMKAARRDKIGMAVWADDAKNVEDAVAALRAQAQGEPVGWFIGDAEYGFHQVAEEFAGKKGTTPLFAALRAPEAADAGMRVSYHDEVTAEQVAAIEKLVAPEFEGGGWVEVESEAFLASGEADAAPASYGKQHLTGPAIDAIENAQDTDKEEMDATLPGRALPGVELIEIPLDSLFLTECPNMKAYAVKTDVLAILSQRPNTGGEELVRDAYKFETAPQR
jgi:hypothetical protein